MNDLKKGPGNIIAEITTGGNNHFLHVVCPLGNLARAMKMSEDLHDVI